jgi:hypothetical protein
VRIEPKAFTFATSTPLETILLIFVQRLPLDLVFQHRGLVGHHPQLALIA